MKFSLLLFISSVLYVSGTFLNKNAVHLNNHHTNQEVFELIEQVNKKCPNITHVYDLDLKSVRGLPLRVIAFSDNPSVHELGEPEFKYVANMHGNEVIGREMLTELMVQMCDAYLSGNSNVMSLIQATRIHLLITMNPDGWDIAVQNEFKRVKNQYGSVAEMLEKRGVKHWMNGRANANSVDLNRNFPDLDVWEYKYQSEGKDKFDHLVMESSQEIDKKHVDCVNNTYQPETLTVAKWIRNNPFVLSANLHGGDLVVNYPYDDSKDHKTHYAASPDDALFKDIAYTFAYYHANMTDPERKQCDMVGSGFHDGITNGANWYPVCGGMQDYNYLASNCFEVTIELGCDKFPPGNTLAQYWKDNVDSFYEFMWLSHIGIKGAVTFNGRPVGDAKIIVAKINGDEEPELIEHNVLSTETGEYWRLLNDGSYLAFAEADGGLRSEPVLIEVKAVAFSEAHIVNFELMEEDQTEQQSDEFLDGSEILDEPELSENGLEEDEYMALLNELLNEKNQEEY